MLFLEPGRMCDAPTAGQRFVWTVIRSNEIDLGYL